MLIGANQLQTLTEKKIYKEIKNIKSDNKLAQ